MLQAGESFFTIIGCMDGRVQGVVVEFGRKKFNAIYPDTITEAGLAGKLAKEQIDPSFLDSLRFKILDVSISKHHSKGIIVHGHEECAGNPVNEEKHKDDIRKSIEVIKSLINSSIPIAGIFVKRSSQDPSKWEIVEV